MVPRSFRHPQFQQFEFDAVPLNCDIYLMDARWMPEWEAAYIDLFNGGELKIVGYISYASVRAVFDGALEISWYPNIFDRFHEVIVMLPRDAFVSCVEVADFDGKPHIFVKSDWLRGLYSKPYSAFALIDAIGTKQALAEGRLSGTKLIALRDRIDQIAEAYPKVAFVSFADSLLLKVNWFVGEYDSEIKYSYEPESLIRIFPQIALAFKEILGIPIYATIAQGFNEYADHALMHYSDSGAHVSLNSLGLPFAQLLSIENAAREAFRSGAHGPYEIYADQLFFHSLHFKRGFDAKLQTTGSYEERMSSRIGKYYCLSMETLLKNLDYESGS